MNPSLYGDEIGGDISSATDTSEYDYGNVLTHDLLGDLWDQKKSRMCVCDSKWTDVDCSRRMCPKGNDVLSRSNEGDSACDTDTAFGSSGIAHDFATDENQVQTICLYEASAAPTGEVALVYTDLFGTQYTTAAVEVGAPAADFETALRSLPDHALEDVVVTLVADPDTDCAAIAVPPLVTSADVTLIGTVTYIAYTVEFTGAQVSGRQMLLDVKTDACTDGCQPSRTGLQEAGAYYFVAETTVAAGNAYECGRRGKCDYSTGICECFTGFTDEDCSTQSALA